MGVYLTRGQTTAVELVRRAVETERPPHALLLVGPTGVGKTTLALDLAAGLLCLAVDPAARPCRECAACRKVAHGNHPDLHVLAPEGAGQQIRVAQIQGLASDLALLPLEGRFRLAIIETAHRMNVDAQNAILKTLEEPPAKVVLILCADDSAGLLPTVVSRCARARLGPVGGAPIAQLLSEHGLADAARAASLARLAGGRPGVALALAAQPEASVVQSRLAGELLDLLGANRRRRLAAPAELLTDAAELLRVTGGRPQEESKPRRASGSGAAKISPAERRAAAGQLLAVWRDVARDLAVATRGGVRELREHELLDELAAAGAAVDPVLAARFLDQLETVSRALDAYANPELAVDALLLVWPSTRRAA
ncbi:MAG: DNA polymerase III subunit delta' [Chloroflexota bacterium]